MVEGSYFVEKQRRVSGDTEVEHKIDVEPGSNSGGGISPLCDEDIIRVVCF